MQRLSSPRIFLSHLEIARSLIAGVCGENDAIEIIEELEKENPEVASKRMLVAAKSLLNAQPIVLGGTDISFVSAPAILKSEDRNFLSNFVVFDLDQAILRSNAVIDEAIEEGSFIGCRVSGAVQERLLLGRERSALRSHFNMSALDHFNSDIFELLRQVPGVFFTGPRSWIWAANLHKEDATLAFSWIEYSGLSEIVTFAAVQKNDEG